MNKPLRWALFWLVVFWWGGMLIASAQGLSSSVEDQRFHALSKELRCLVCQNESLAESPAGLADDLRQELRAQITLGKTDQEIKNYLVERYGYFVLYKPPFIGRTLLLWLAPLLILLGLSSWLIWQFRLKRARGTGAALQPEAVVDHAELEKIKQEFEQEKN